MRFSTMLGVLLFAASWLVVSDIHFDPFGDQKIVERLAATPGDHWRNVFAGGGPEPTSGYLTDTNYTLLESTLDAMRNVQGEPPAIVLTGDFLAHHFREKYDKAFPGHDDAAYAAFVDNTILFLATEFRSAYPRARFVPAIGNNDSYCGDYQTTPNSPFFAKFAAAWGLNPSTNGYYTVALPLKNVTAVVTDDIFMSAKYQNACGEKNADPANDEMAWLTATLNAFAGQKIWFITHIPPGIDPFASLLDPAGTPPVMFLAPKYNDALISALATSKANIVAALAGHTHMNDYRIIGLDASRPTVGMLVNPAVSPIFAGNPTFAEIRVDENSGAIEDAKYYTLEDLAALSKSTARSARWRLEFDFNVVYGNGAIDAEHLSRVQQELFGDDKLRKHYEIYHDGGSGRAPVTDSTWRAYWCSNVALTLTAYLACAAPQVQPVKRP